MKEEWSVRHSQGVHPGPFTEESARAWVADDIRRDAQRQRHARGLQRLLRRYVTEWEEVPLTAPVPVAAPDEEESRG